MIHIKNLLERTIAINIKYIKCSFLQHVNKN